MTFWEHFLRLLPRRPKPALAALYWYLTRRRVRASNRLRAGSADLAFVYAAWIKSNEQTDDLANCCASALKHWPFKPHFSILLHADGPFSAEQVDSSTRSIQRQIYPHWRIAGNADEPLAPRILAAEADFLVPLRVGELLSSAALFRFAEAAQANRAAAIIYGDEDQLDQHDRRVRPWFKPQWNEELFLALDYLSSAVAIEAGLAREVSAATDPADVSGLLLAATAAAQGQIVHVPHILCNVPATRPSPEGRLEAVARHLAPVGATCSPGPFGTVKVQWPLPQNLPLVSIIIPTKDKIELLRPCVRGVLERTDYPHLELLIVDNASIEARTARFLDEVAQDSRVRVLHYPEEYNFSRINNFAARQAGGAYLCLLNNDTEVIDPAWLTELMRYAVRPEIGAVGAKLLYPDGSIQHAGIVIGIGEAAGHAHRFLAAGQPGYFGVAHVPQFISAVTAACLVVEKSKFGAVGGLDETIAVAFNDVDLCLKLQAAGWRNVYAPQAVMVHHESKSRGIDVLPASVERFRGEHQALQSRWSTKSYQDPNHHPNLDRHSETFVIRL